MACARRSKLRKELIQSGDPEFKPWMMRGLAPAGGTQVVLQHAPADTGLPFWLYTLYSHFNQMPAWEIGQRVRMGEVLGPNGRSGGHSETLNGITDRVEAILPTIYRKP